MGAEVLVNNLKNVGWKDFGKVFMPQKVGLSYYLKAAESTKQTHAALDAYRQSLAGED